jgi:hypothetical protein
MNYISWNCRGIGSKGFKTLVKDICREYNSSMIFLLETHAKEEKALCWAKKFGLDGCYIQGSQG